jgi:hypothetical protein
MTAMLLKDWIATRGCRRKIVYDFVLLPDHLMGRLMTQQVCFGRKNLLSCLQLQLDGKAH